MFELFYGDKIITFTGGGRADASPAGSLCWEGPGKSIAKMLEKLENSNTLIIKADDPEAAFGEAASLFVNVDAAGGVVLDGHGALLMIKRNGRWDIPKGHIEHGETAVEAAVREVCEETGIGTPEAAEILTVTHHFYCLKGVWELKHTYWYLMRGDGTGTPQTEEGIEAVRWISRQEIPVFAAGAFASVKSVLRKAGLF